MATRQNRKKKFVLVTTFVVIVACSLLLMGCYQILAVLQLRSITTLGWEGDRYLWMAGGFGVVRWDVNRQVIVERTFSPSGISQFLVSKEGQVWGYGDDGVWLFEAGKWIKMGETSGLQRGKIYDMVQTNDGTIWVATWWGFKTWNEETRLWEPTLINQPGFTLVQGLDDSLWFGLTEDGVIRLRSGELTHWTAADGLIDNRIVSILPASDGTIWVGTRRGVSRWDGNRWQGWERLGYPYHPDGLRVSRLLETKDGTIWAATNEDFARWKHGEWTTYQRAPACFTSFALLETNDGSLWAGCSTGLYRWTGSSWREYGKSEGIPDNRWSRLIQGTNGILYAATRSGIYQYVPEQDHWQSFPNR